MFKIAKRGNAIEIFHGLVCIRTKTKKTLAWSNACKSMHSYAVSTRNYEVDVLFSPPVKVQLNIKNGSKTVIYEPKQLHR
jgi:hypothetical protein